MYLKDIYSKLVKTYFDKNRELGKSDYDIKKMLPKWLLQRNAAEFANTLANAIVRFRMTNGPITNFEQLQFIRFNFENMNMNIRGDLYNELVANTILPINVNLVTAEELSRIKGFNYNNAFAFINERKKLGYFKNKQQVRYYMIKHNIPQKYYDNVLSKVITTADLKNASDNQTTSDYKYLFKKPVPVKPINELFQSYQPKVNTPTNSAIPAPAVSGVSNGKVNINVATAGMLESELNINRLNALLIYKYKNRLKNGKYNTIEQVKSIPGLSETVYSKIKSKITVR